MNRKRVWRKSEEQLLIDNYTTKTIKELEHILNRPAESINGKIKQLKKDGKIKDTKEDHAVRRAYEQRCV